MTGFFDFPQDWQEHWQGMPSFRQEDLTPFQSLTVHFRSPEDRKAFAELIGRSISTKAVSVWYPKERIDRSVAFRRYVAEEKLSPRHPVYIISKGRWKCRHTSKTLEKMQVSYHIVVEPQEYDEYAAVIDPKKILVLPFSNLGKGSIPARNWVWEHSVQEGATRHWILDDNIRNIYRLVGNVTPVCSCGNVFYAAEDFVDRYENIALAGFQYYMFITRKSLFPPYVLNTRIYSCILIRNDVYPEGHRWRGRYNEDTDLSLRILKDGWCTVLFNAFLAHKNPTMKMKGGNTEELYQGDGRLDMAKSLQEQHPDCVTVSRKWGRWQHQVDYGRFRKNKLKPKGSLHNVKGVNEYGMYLVDDEEHTESLLLIGQSPSRNGDPEHPLEGKIGERLAKLAGISFEDYLLMTERMNLFEEWTGESRGKGDAWDAKEARKHAKELMACLRGRRTIFVGRNVAAAFGFSEMPWLTWTVAHEGMVAVVPHPSGIVLWWNSKENRKAASKFLKDAFGSVSLET